MAQRAWRVLSSCYLVDDHWLRVRADRCERPDGSIVEPFYVLEDSDWVGVIALTDAGNAVILDEYRHGAGTILAGIPGGVIDAGETPTEAGARELLEETGYRAREVIELAAMNPNPARQINQTHVVLALGCERVAEQMLEQTEDITVREVPWCDVGLRTFDHALHVAAVAFAKEYLAKI